MVTSAPPRRTRTPQAERRARTRGSLLDAAIESLAERGYAATTTVEVAARAGVSRGAQQHYFRSKAELVAAAIEHAFNQRVATFAATSSGSGGGDLIDESIDVLWSMFEGPVCVAWVELLVAARTDPELRSHLGVVGERMRAAAEAQFHSLMRDANGDEVFYPVAMKFVFALFDGLVLHRMAGYDADAGRTEDTVEAMKLLAHLVFPGGRPVPRARRRPSPPRDAPRLSSRPARERSR
jgi:AcrR family transcriptional regulator